MAALNRIQDGCENSGPLIRPMELSRHLEMSLSLSLVKSGRQGRSSINFERTSPAAGLRRSLCNRQGEEPRAADIRRRTTMPELTATIPHQLGRAEAKRRIQHQIGNLRNEYSSLVSNLSDNWTGDTMAFSLTA